ARHRSVRLPDGSPGDPRPVAVVTGMIATYPVGGVAWDYGQYALGLERLGFEVWYLEDTGGSTYDPQARTYGEDCSYGVGFLAGALAFLSPALGRRWHFRAMDNRVFGVDAATMAQIAAQADLFLNVSGSALLRDEYMPCARKVLIDTDPGWNHFVNYPRWDASPGWQGTHGYRAHDHYFTYAEGIGSRACRLPLLGIDWRCTRPPVVLDCWRPEPRGRHWTTVMTWNNFRRPVAYEGVLYGTKEMEFGKIEELPPRCPGVDLEIAVGGDAPIARWQERGWRVVDSHAVSRTTEDYRTYIEQSRGEISVAKNLYVATGSGWFSCRSVCYLAASRPVILQDTGYSQFVPTGEGLLAFRAPDEARAALAAVEGDYERHAAAARQLAEEHFAAPRVLGRLLADIGL
ncbi:MAG: hypothetical protein AB1505_28805, partial [Candidatus Latescibacterota bacterium]